MFKKVNDVKYLETERVHCYLAHHSYTYYFEAHAAAAS